MSNTRKDDGDEKSTSEENSSNDENSANDLGGRYTYAATTNNTNDASNAVNDETSANDLSGRYTYAATTNNANDASNAESAAITESFSTKSFEEDFIHISTLSEGITGSASLYKCNHPALKNFSADGRVVVKILKEKKEEEVSLRGDKSNRTVNNNNSNDTVATKETKNDSERIAKHAEMTYAIEVAAIQSLSLANDRPGLLRPKTQTVEYSGKKYILNECILNDENNAQTVGACIKVMGALARNFTTKELNESKHNAKLVSIFSGIKAAIDQLHQDQWLHLDPGCRNFMMDKNGVVKLIDFGMSLNLDAKSGYSHANPGFFFVPFLSYNQAAITAGEHYPYGINTDLFGLRMAIINGLGEYLGLLEGSSKASEMIFGIHANEKKDALAKISSLKDSDRLQQAYENLEAFAANIKTSEAIIVLSLLQDLKPYLTTYSADMKNNPVEYKKSDTELFNQCIAVVKEEEKENKEEEKENKKESHFHGLFESKTRRVSGEHALQSQTHQKMKK